MAERILIVLPDESARPILDIIEGARRTLRIKMFAFTDPALLDAVVGAHQRGVNVRVMLNAVRRSGHDDNKTTRTILSKAGIAHADANPTFGVTHEKSMIVDETEAVVGSLNWVTENLTETRDYAIVTTHRKGVEEVLECFEADWHRQSFTPGTSAHMIWCPNDGRERIARFIDEAKHTLFVQNERYQDDVIIERLVRARMRGVKIHVMARPPHTLKEDKLVEGVGGLRIMDDVGIKIHKLRHLKLHGKMLLRDGSRAIVGSINLAPGSFDDRRELAIEFSDEDIIDRLQKVARHDWKHSHPMDLTDQGILDDLSKRYEGTEHRLALSVEGHKKHGHKRKGEDNGKGAGKERDQAKRTRGAKAGPRVHAASKSEAKTRDTGGTRTRTRE